MNKLILTDQSSGTRGGAETDKLSADEDIEMLRASTPVRVQEPSSSAVMID